MVTTSEKMMQLIDRLAEQKSSEIDKSLVNYGIHSKALDAIHETRNFKKAECY